MQCLFCKRSIPLFRRLKDAEFCSNEHRNKFMQQHVRMAAERLLTNNVHKNVNRTAEPRRAEFERAIAVNDVDDCPSDDLLLAALVESSLVEDSSKIGDFPTTEELQQAISQRESPLEHDFLDQSQAVAVRGSVRPVRSQEPDAWQCKAVLPRLYLPRRIRRRLGGLALLQLSMKNQHASAELSLKTDWKWPEKNIVQFRAQVVPVASFSNHSEGAVRNGLAIEHKGGSNKLLTGELLSNKPDSNLELPMNYRNEK